ncbi:MAG TPA: ABC transporter ATP-binding protein [Blastocatellia bacterium]|nr:ABC transporter ATP-binding protein [Blastocatellia bacterium]
MSFIAIEQVTKIYRPDGPSSEVTVLRNITSAVAETEFVALEGPSGSGKTTLLTIIGAMNRPTGGRVVIDGIDLYGLKEEELADFRREYIGFVFQQHHLLPYLTALENVMLPLAIVRMPAREKRVRAAAVLALVSLGAKASRLPSELSGGEQGRVAIARAIVNEPPLILADEPTGNLDSKTGRDIIECLNSLKDQAHTVVMVTHNPEASAAADRVLRIHDGRLVSTESFSVGSQPAQHLLNNSVL